MKCLVIANTHNADSQLLSKGIADYLLSRGSVCEVYNFDGTFNDSPFLGYDLVITLGGDGTVLFAARGCVKSGTPIFAVNLGQFGFIASVQKDDWQLELEKVLLGKTFIDERLMINVAIVSSKYGNAFSGIALNDAVVSAKMAARTITFEVFYNDIDLGTFKADGVIVSTPTGSTAYSASSGGPIIEPDANVLLLTPINSFSLSARPLVFSSNGEIGIKILESREPNAIITLDGQKPFVVAEGDFIKVRKLQQKVRLLSCAPRKFYDALRTKLNWAGGPHLKLSVNQIGNL